MKKSELANVIKSSHLQILKRLDDLEKQVSCLKQPRIDELITEQELCKRIKKTPETCRAWRNKGILPFKRISRKVYYSWSDVQEAFQTKKLGGHND